MTDSTGHLINKLQLLGRANEDSYFRQVDDALVARIHAAAAKPIEQVGPEPLFSTIPVPVDFSTNSRLALRYAADLADAFDSSVVVLNVLKDDVLEARILGRFAANSPGHLDVINDDVLSDMVAEQRDQAYTSLESALPTALTKHPVELRVLVGNPAKCIVETAERENVDVIVMGTHGRTGWSHLMVGSVAERVVRLAPCPVLTLKEESQEK